MSRAAVSASRLAAVRAVNAVLGRGRSLSDALPSLLGELAPADRAFAQALTYGVLRHRRRLEALAGDLLARPLKARDRDVHVALLLGLHQLADEAAPAHAAVAETAGLARALGKPWAVGLLNGTLRRFQREREARLAALGDDPGIVHSLPDWLVAQWRADWPADWRAIAAASNAHPPMTLRVARAGGAEAYARTLAEAHLPAHPVPGVPDALTLERPCAVDRLPGFDTGAVAVQDAAAQLAAPLVAPADGERVLDACAAPGGKTAHLLALAPGARVTALDSDPGRLERVRGNLERLGGAAELRAGDATRVDAWWDGAPFDRILLDAPCSATGVIRRHPDIKWLRRAADIPRLAAVQGDALAALWTTLRPGGRLVYATCSTLAAENEAVVSAFLHGRTDAVVVPPALPAGRPQSVGHQILPGDGDMDGFYYACLEKR